MRSFAGDTLVLGSCAPLFLPRRIYPTRTAPRCTTAGASVTIPIPGHALVSGSHFLAQWMISAGPPGVWSSTRALDIEIQ
jgi:hypothetical protein